MDFTAKHIGFVLACYALSVIFIGGLIIRVLVKDRRLRAEAQRLEAQRLETQRRTGRT
jgi:heme exporter protein CcmD